MINPVSNPKMNDQGSMKRLEEELPASSG